MTAAEDIESLYESVRRGDKLAREQLFRILAVRFGLVARNRILDPEAAEDAVQETLMVVSQELNTAAPRGSFSSWAYTVLRHRILTAQQKTHRNSTRRDPSAEIETVGSTASETDPDLLARLRECLKQLARGNRRYARILNLHYQGYDTDEVGRRLNMKANQVYVVLWRARAQLQECLDAAGVLR